jgi:protein TonB
MSVEEKRNSAEQIGTLSSCLIEADPEQKARERKIKRRALVISIVLQSLVIVALVLVPLLGRTEKLPYTLFTPIPQYYHSPPRPVVHRPTVAPPLRPTGFYAPTNIPPTIATRDYPPPTNEPTSPDAIDIGNTPTGPSNPNGLNILDNRRGPTPPADTDRDKKKRISVGGAVQQAMLTHRVEPSYPPLARPLRISGQVHLRAVIATDGSIQSLQVMDGHPLLVQSALDAVRQWHYQPTKLNGQPVEVETIITVVYTLNQ